MFALWGDGIRLHNCFQKRPGISDKYSSLEYCACPKYAEHSPQIFASLNPFLCGFGGGVDEGGYVGFELG